MTDQFKPVQKIIFGSPGTGKSYQVRKIAEEELSIDFDEDTKTLKNTVKTVFHPEYTYADFVGKLLPFTYGNSVVYKYYSGHFLQALGNAYRGLIDDKGEKNYLLVIDELNRGNAAAIFGAIFQLLDRENDGWSTYEICISELELVGLLNAMGYTANITHNGVIHVDDTSLKKFSQQLQSEYSEDQHKSRLLKNLENNKISIPPNLSIIATINTSDESIYYLDSAFKRRWDWEYVDAPSESNKDLHSIPPEILNLSLSLSDDTTLDWYRCIIGINEFIKLHHQSIRKIEDKQIGWWFIKPTNQQITLKEVKDKLIFYLWDGVFAKNKQALNKFIKDKLNKPNVLLITYADFSMYTEELLSYWHDSVPSVKTNSKDNVSTGF